MRSMGYVHNNFQALSDFCSSLKNIAFTIIYNNGKSNFFSNNIIELTGYTPQEIEALPDKHYSLVCNEDIDTLKKNLIELESDTSKNFTELVYRINFKAGGIVWIRETIKFFRDKTGEIAEKHSALIDISSIKEKERALEKLTDSLKELNVAKDKFISIVWHDF